MTVASKHLRKLGLELNWRRFQRDSLVITPHRVLWFGHGSSEVCPGGNFPERIRFGSMLNSTEFFNISKSLPVGTPELDLLTLLAPGVRKAHRNRECMFSMFSTGNVVDKNLLSPAHYVGSQSTFSHWLNQEASPSFLSLLRETLIFWPT